MEKFIQLFEEFTMKVVTMTEDFIEKDFSKSISFESFTDNRDRLLQIIDQISRQVNWDEVADEKKAELNRQIEYIKKLDDKLIVKLQTYQQEVKREIEQTVRSKDNIKGYNLNDVK